jgi:hypothetical protein
MLFIKKLLLFVFLVNVTSFLKAQNNSIILGRPTDTSITASVMFTQVYNYYLEYGLQPGIYNNNTATYTSVSNQPEEIELSQLTANTRYYYRLRYRTIGTTFYNTSNEFSFITQRTPGSTFNFTIEADEHLYDKKGVANMFNVTLNNQAKGKPDFMLSLGDIFGDDHSYLDHTYTITAGELDTLHRNYRPFLGQICHSIPFFIALGNHEGERKHHFTYPIPAPNNLPINGTLSRKKYFPNPFPNTFYSGNNTTELYGVDKPENYYAWTWGDALFVVLDPYRYDSRSDTSAKPQGWDWTLGITQYLWLKNTLETSTSKYKFVFAHHIRGEGRGGITNAIQNEWGGYQRIANGTTTTGSGYTFPTNRPAAEGWTKPIHNLFKDNNVSIFFQGHDHVFAHEVLDSIVYQSCPMAADSTYQIGFLANAGAYLSDTLDGTGHIKVTVSPAYAKVDYIRAYLPADTLSGLHHNGEIAFSYLVRAKNTYTFIGNGNWSDANNWLENKIPPSILPSGNYIYIEPADGGQCILDITQTIQIGAKINVNSNKKLIIPGVLNIQQ